MEEFASMPSALASLIGTTGLSAFIALLVVWLTSRLASIRAHDDRVWDRKAGAYAAIFEALYDMDLFFGKQLQDYYRNRDIPEDESNERYRHYQAARQRLGQVIAREVWILSPAVLAETNELNRSFAVRADNWFDDMDSGAAAVVVAQTGIASVAAAALRRPQLMSIGNGLRPSPRAHATKR